MDSPEAIEYHESVGDLRAYIRLNRSIPRHLLVDSCLPPGDEPNIILVTAEKAFLYNKGRLARKSPTFAQAHMSNLSDDSVDIVDDCPVINLDDGDRTGDVFCFLRALADDDLSPYPLHSKRDYYYLSGVLCLTSRYRILEMRIKAIMVLEKLYPTNFDAWNHTRKLIRQFDWRLEHTDVINLARWVDAPTILPGAMAALANDMSADEVFNVPFDECTPIRHPVKLNGADAPCFATMKEHHHISTRKMLLWMRTLGEGCNDPPEYVPSMAGKAPVGALKPKPSQCATAFKAVASNLLDEVYLVKPVGYADFYDMVAAVELDKTRVCKKCRQKFERGHVEMREKWWDVVPKIMGFNKGWEDERLRPAESWLSPQPVEQLHQMMIDFQII